MMPIIDVTIDQAARAAYLEEYKAQAIDSVNRHTQAVWRKHQTTEPWISMVYARRAQEAYAYLNDPDPAPRMQTYYNTVRIGIPFYGATYEEVADSYIRENGTITYEVVMVYEDHRHTLQAIPTKTDKAGVDHAVAEFVRQHPAGV